MKMKMPGRESFMKFAVAAVAALVLGSLASCGEITTTPTDPNKQNVMHGVITGKGLPLQGVQVSGGTELVTSDPAGNYRTYLPPGNRTIVFTKSGYNTVSMPVTAETKSVIKADVDMTTQTTTVVVTGGDTFTVSPGASQAVQVTGPGRLSFTVVGINMDLDKDAWPVIFFYDSKGYTGGKGGSGGFNGDLRNFKLKYYDANGVIASESYYVEPKGNTPRWNPAVARTVSLEWGSDFVTSTIDGIPFRKPGSVAGTFIVGIGYPPSIRNGWDKAVYTNIVWPAGSTKVK
jgi:hypothetical protein